MKQTYFTSGEFARLCGTTKETLRHYNNIGLLKPAKTTENGYQYYSAFQFYDFYFISTFKGTGMHLKELEEKLAETDERAFCDTLRQQLKKIQAEKKELIKKEKLLKRTIEKFDYLYEGDRVGSLELYEMEEEYYIATPVKGNADDDRVWMETLKDHLDYCHRDNLNEEYQLTYCWNMEDMQERRTGKGWSIMSQLSEPADDPRLHVKPAGTYACALFRGYDFTTEQLEKVKNQIEKRGLKICGDAYEADVSLFSPGMKAGYVTEISIMVEKND